MLNSFKACVLCLTVLFAVCMAQRHTVAQPSGAPQESEVVFYVSANLTTGQAIANAFKIKYPNIDVKIYRTSGGNMVNKVATEKRAGRILFDVIYGAAVPFLPTLSVLQPYES